MPRLRAKSAKPRSVAHAGGRAICQQPPDPGLSFFTTEARGLGCVAQVRLGLPTRTVERFIKDSNLERDPVLHVMGISKRTLERKADASLNREQSDRLARVKRVYDLATDLIGDEARARVWLQTANRALRGEKPLELLDTDAGTRLVEDVLIRVSNGIFS